MSQFHFCFTELKLLARGSGGCMAQRLEARWADRARRRGRPTPPFFGGAGETWPPERFSERFSGRRGLVRRRRSRPANSNVIDTVARGPGGVGRTWGITVPKAGPRCGAPGASPDPRPAAGAAHLGHHRWGIKSGHMGCRQRTLWGKPADTCARAPRPRVSPPQVPPSPTSTPSPRLHHLGQLSAAISVACRRVM